VTVTAGHSHLPQDEKIRTMVFLAEVKERLAKGEDPDEIFASIPSDILEACDLSSLKQSFMRFYRQSKTRNTAAEEQTFHF
jgi:hypothetical protein